MRPGVYRSGVSHSNSLSVYCPIWILRRFCICGKHRVSLYVQYRAESFGWTYANWFLGHLTVSMPCINGSLIAVPLACAASLSLSFDCNHTCRINACAAVADVGIGACHYMFTSTHIIEIIRRMARSMPLRSVVFNCCAYVDYTVFVCLSTVESLERIRFCNCPRIGPIYGVDGLKLIKCIDTTTVSSYVWDRCDH